MKFTTGISIFGVMGWAGILFAQTPLGSEFTFQGRLESSGSPVISNADFQFALFDDVSGGMQIGATLSKAGVATNDGTFAVTLDFGSDAFSGEARWLEVAVRSPAGTGGFTTLSPRQALFATPNSTFSMQTRGITVDQAGQVGIGTAVPGKPLTVVGDMELDSTPGTYRNLRIGGAAGDGFLYSGSFFGSPGVTDGVHLGYNCFSGVMGQHQAVDPQLGTARLSLNFGEISLATAANGQSPIKRMVVSEAGNVGIGTTTPQAKLQVDGEMRVFGSSYISTLDTTLRVMGGRQGVSAPEQLIWKLGDYLTIVPGDPIENIYNPELKMISPVTSDELAGFFRDYDTGNGVMFADDKNFRAPNPADASTDIWYCCPEGPEAAMYVRGIGTLTNGRGYIELPDHFRNLASEPGMTVQLTPRSLDSRGLATTKVSLSGIEVGELQGGTGNYEFDWRVEAVRKGWEDYKVVRPWLRSDENPEKAWQSRLKAIEERRAHGKPSPDVTMTTPRPQE